MPFCPSCNEDITDLSYSEPRIVLMSFSISSYDGVLYPDYAWDGDVDLELDDSLYESGYRCPMCGAELAENEAQAVEFLSKPT